MKKKLLVFGLLAAMLAALAACGSGKDTVESANADKPEFVYVPEYFEWDVEEPENGYISTYNVVNGYMLGELTEWDAETGMPHGEILKYDVQTRILERIAFDTGSTDEYVNAITVKQDGTLAVITQKYEWNEDTREGKSYYRMLQLDAAGQILSETDLTELLDTLDAGDAYLSNVAVDKDDVIYIALDQTVAAVDTEGKLLFKVEMDNWIDGMGVTEDGKAYVLYYGQNGVELGILDKAAAGFSAEYALDNYNSNGSITITDDAMMYYNDGNALQRVNLETKECEAVVQWLDVDISGQYVDCVYYLDEDTSYAHYRDWSADEEGFIKLTKTDASLVTEKKILMMAALTSDSDLQNKVVAFNKHNTEYRIKLKTYLDYNTMSDADWENYDQFLSDATTRMLNDITGSNAPDIIFLQNGTNSLNLKTLADKGVLEEITPYLEKAGYSEDDFVQGLLNCYKVQDRLYTLPGRFYLNTMLADSAIVGDKQGWTVGEAMEIIKNLPEGMAYSEYDTQQYFIQSCITYGYDNFVDAENGTCNFESDEFKAILEMSKMFPQEIDYNEEQEATPIRIQQGEILTTTESISQLEDIQLTMAYYGDKTPTFIGIPGVGGNGSMLASYSGMYAVCSKSEEKEVAASFVIDIMTEPYDPDVWNAWGFPSLQSELDAYIKEQITVKYLKDENGELILDENGDPIPENSGGGMGWGNWSYEYRPCTQEDADILLNLINGATAVRQDGNDAISTLIMEEVEAFINGQKTADEVATIVQNRVNLYLMENS